MHDLVTLYSLHAYTNYSRVQIERSLLKYLCETHIETQGNY